MPGKLLPIFIKIWFFWTNTSSSNTKFDCGFCLREFASKATLVDHKKSVHKGIRFQCDKSDHKANQEAGLIRHQQTIHGGRKYNYDSCDFTAKTKKVLLEHKNSNHKRVTQFDCDVCGLQFPSKATRWQAQEVTAWRNNIAMCSPCNYESRSSKTRANFTPMKKVQLRFMWLYYWKQEYALHPPKTSHASAKFDCDICGSQVCFKGKSWNAQQNCP